MFFTFQHAYMNYSAENILLSVIKGFCKTSVIFYRFVIMSKNFKLLFMKQHYLSLALCVCYSNT